MYPHFEKLSMLKESEAISWSCGQAGTNFVQLDDPDYIQPESILTTSSAEEPKKTIRTRKPWVYKSEYDKILTQRDQYKSACKIMGWIILFLLFTQIFGEKIIDLLIL